MTVARRRLLRLSVCLCLCVDLGPTLARAVEPGEMMSDPKLEARARALSSELRCLVCQNQSIDDSHAALAKDLRLLVRERLAAGDSDAAVRDYLVARYGDFVRLKPPFNQETALLWGLPFLVLGGGAIGLLLARRKGIAPTAAPLSTGEQAEIDRLIGAPRA